MHANSQTQPAPNKLNPTMGYDANIKSTKAQSRQRNTLLTIFVICAGLFLIKFLIQKEDAGPKKIYTNSSPQELSNRMQQERADGSKPAKLRANTEHNGDEKLEAAAALHVQKLDEEVRALKATGIIMETDKHALELTSKLQRATRELIKLRYGEITAKNTNFKVKMELEFQNTIPDFEEKGKDGVVVIELAPIGLLPCSVSTSMLHRFLKNVVNQLIPDQ